jgi:L-ascorbate metabolism protein UlaG (beta-lactamase superfamily)
MTDIRFLGHSCFELTEGSARVLIDPFLKPNNPISPVSADDLEDPTQILVTHGHADHLADAAGLAKRSGAQIAAIVELAHWFDALGVENTTDPNLGGTVEFEGGWAKLVQAFHTSTAPGKGDDPFSAETGVAIGQAAGWVVNLGGTTFYHLGDTCLFGDLKLIAERTPVDVAMVPIGGHYTMDRHDAVAAVELIGPKIVIPMHYNTFPAIETDAEAFKADVESQTSAHCVVLAPGESHSKH